MDYLLTGVVTHYKDKSDVSKKDGKPFTAWAIRVEEPDGQWPNAICGEYFGETIVPPSIGQTVTVHFNPRCNALPDGRFFGKEQIWKIEYDAAASTNAPIAPADGVDVFAALNPGFAAPGPEDPNDLPFNGGSQ